MESLDHWRLCEDLNVRQAALLIVGVDPTGSYNIDHWNETPRGYEAAETALRNAIRNKRLSANIVEIEDVEGAFGRGPVGQHNWDQTTVSVEDLQVWLRSRGITTGFFFPTPEDAPNYLSRRHDNYSPKLAAAIEAWKAVSTDEKIRSGKTVKQALVVWLRKHADEFGLTKDDGNPNEQGIEDVAKVANWDTAGGVPKTPGND
jgi:hypothetical protein